MSPVRKRTVEVSRCRCIPGLQIAVVAMWVLWMLAPPAVVPPLGSLLELWGPPMLFALLLLAAAFVLWRRPASRSAFAWSALSAVCLAFLLSAALLIDSLITFAELEHF